MHLDHVLRWIWPHSVIVDAIEPHRVIADYLDPNYPNPFNPVTTIRYGVREQSHVSLRVYNVAAQLVKTLVDETRTPLTGGYVARWDGTSNAGEPVASGVYFYRLVTKEFTKTRRMVLLK